MKDVRSVGEHDCHTLRAAPEQVRSHNEREVGRSHLRDLRYPFIEEDLEERNDEEDDATIDSRQTRHDSHTSIGVMSVGDTVVVPIRNTKASE